MIFLTKNWNFYIFRTRPYSRCHRKCWTGHHPQKKWAHLPSEPNLPHRDCWSCVYCQGGPPHHHYSSQAVSCCSKWGEWYWHWGVKEDGDKYQWWYQVQVPLCLDQVEWGALQLLPLRKQAHQGQKLHWTYHKVINSNTFKMWLNTFFQQMHLWIPRKDDEIWRCQL